MGKTIALVVAAGSGSRAGGEAPKQYRLIAGRPLLAHAIDHLRHPAVDEIRVVIGARITGVSMRTGPIWMGARRAMRRAQIGWNALAGKFGLG